MDELNSELGRLIKHYREKHSISTRKLSDAIGKSATYVWQLENGNVKHPPYDVLKQIFNIIGLDESLLYSHFGLMPPEVEEMWKQQDEARLEAEEEYAKQYKEEINKRLQTMLSDDLAVLLLMMDRYSDVIGQIATLNQYEPLAAHSIREYVDFLYKKHIDNTE